MEVKRDGAPGKTVRRRTNGATPDGSNITPKPRKVKLKIPELKETKQKVPRKPFVLSRGSTDSPPTLRKYKSNPDSEKGKMSSTPVEPSTTTNQISMSLQEENEFLRKESARVQDLLSMCRAERDEAVIKFNALSQKFEDMLKHKEDVDFHFEESFDRLHCYEENMARQAELVAKLQAKVHQYKERCLELESSRHEWSRSGQDELALAMERLRIDDHERSLNLDTVLLNLESETKRSNNLMNEVKRLGDQLEDSYSINRSMASDLQKISFELARTSKDLEAKQTFWHEEMKKNNEIIRKEHVKLLSLWKETQALKTEYSEVKTCTKADFIKLKQHFEEMSFFLRISCQQVEANYIISDSCDKSLEEISKTPAELWQRIQELKQYNSEGEFQRKAYEDEIADCKNKIDELKEELAHSSVKHNDISQNNHHLRNQLNEVNSQLHKYEDALKLIHSLQSALKEVAQLALELADSQSLTSHPEMKLVLGPQAKDLESESIAVIKDNTLHIFHNVLEQRNNDIQTLQKQLCTKDKEIDESSKQIKDLKNRLRHTEDQADQAGLKLDHLTIEMDIVKEERDKLEQKLSKLSSDYTSLDHTRLKLITTLEELECKIKDQEKNKDQDYALQNRMSSEKEELIRAIQEETRQKLDRCKEIQDLKQEIDSQNKAVIELRNQLEEANSKIDLLNVEYNQIEAEHLKCNVIDQLHKTANECSEIEDALKKLEISQSVLLSKNDRLEAELNRVKAEKLSLHKEKLELDSENSSLRQDLLYLEKEKCVGEEHTSQLTTAYKEIEIRYTELQKNYQDLQGEKMKIISDFNTCKSDKIDVDNSVNQLQDRLRLIQEDRDKYSQECGELKQVLATNEIQLSTLKKEQKRLQEEHHLTLNDQQSLELSLYEVKTALTVSEGARDLQEKTIEALSSKMDNLKRVILQLQQDNETLSAEAKKSQWSDLQLNSKLDSLKEQHRSELEAVLSEKSEMLNVKISQLAVLEEKVSTQQESLYNNKEHIARLEEKLRSQEQEYLYLEHVKQRMEEELKNKDHQLQLFKQEVDNMENAQKLNEEDQLVQQEEYGKKLQDAKVLHRQLTLKVKELTQAMQEMQVMHADEITLKDEEKKHVIKIRDGLSEQLMRLREQLKDSEIKGDDMEYQLSSAKHELHRSDNELVKLRAALNDLETKIKAESEQAQHYKSCNLKMQEEISSYTSEKMALQQIIRTLQTELNEVTTLKDKIKDLKRELEVKNGMAEQSQEMLLQINKLDEMLSVTKSELGDITDKYNNCEKIINLRNDEIEKLRKSLNDAMLEKCSFEEDINVLKNKLSSIEISQAQKSNEMARKLVELASQKTQFTDQLRSLESLGAQKNDEIQMLKTKLQVEEAKLLTLHRKLDASEMDKQRGEMLLRKILSFLTKIIGLKLNGVGEAIKRPPSPLKVRNSSELHVNPTIYKGSILSQDINPDIIKNGLKDFMSQVSSIEKERDDALSECHALKGTIEDCQQNNKVTESKLAQVLEQLQTVRLEKLRLTDQFKELQSSCTIQKEELRKGNDDVILMKLELQNRQAEIDGVKQKCAEAEAKLSQLARSGITDEKGIQSLKTSLAESENEVHNLRMSEQTWRKEKEFLVSANEDKIKNLLLKIEKLQKDLSSCKILNATLEEHLQESNNTIDKLSSKDVANKQQLDFYNSSLQDKSCKFDAMQANYDECRNKLSEIEGENRRLEKRLHNCKEMNEELKKRNSNLLEEGDRLQAHITNIQLEKSMLENRIHDFEKGIVIEKSTHRELRQNLAQTSQENKQMSNKIKNLNDMVRNLQIRNKELESMKSQAEGDREALRYRMEEMETALGDPHNENGLQLRKSESRSSSRSHGTHSSGLRSRSLRMSNEDLPVGFRRIYDEVGNMSRVKFNESQSNIEEIKRTLADYKDKKNYYLSQSSKSSQEMIALSDTLRNSLSRVASQNIGEDLLHEESKVLSNTIEKCLPPPTPSRDPSHRTMHDGQS